MFREILGWIFANLQAEAAIITWKMAGKSFWTVFWEAGGMATIGALLPYCGLMIFSLLLRFFSWFLRKVFKINVSFRRKKRKKNKWARKAKVTSRLFVRKLVKETKSHPCLILFVLNLVPFAPGLTLATVITVKVLKIPWGIAAVLAGNLLKVFFVTVIVFRINGL